MEDGGILFARGQNQNRNRNKPQEFWYLVREYTGFIMRASKVAPKENQKSVLSTSTEGMFRPMGAAFRSGDALGVFSRYEMSEHV